MAKVKSFWWASLPAERFWCEITDRPLIEVGRNLYCPQSNTSAIPRSFWSYSLIQNIQPGDIVFHYHSGERAIIGVSTATDILRDEPIVWIPHWTGKAKKEKKRKFALPRPGWKRSLTGYQALESPLTLAEIQHSDEFVRQQVASISKQGKPRVFLQMYPKRLRALQGGYVTKMPSVFVDHWKKLRSATELLRSAESFRLQDETAAKLVIADLLEQVESTNRTDLAGQGFSIDPERRKAIENYAVLRAKEFFAGEGFHEIEEVGKPYDLLCFNRDGEGLFVEVKGTTSGGEKVFLTINEVEHAEANSKNSALYVLSGIELNRENGSWRPTGGIPYLSKPWQIDRTRLKALAFQYQLLPER